MKGEFKGFSKIFSFTLRQQLKTRSFKLWTLVLGLICFLIPAILIPTVSVFQKEDTAFDSVPYFCAADRVIIVNNTERLSDFDFSSLPESEMFPKISAESASDLDSAFDSADEKTLILTIDDTGAEFSFTAVLPDDTVLGPRDAQILADYVTSNLPYMLIRASGISDAQLAELNAPIYTSTSAVEEEASPDEPEYVEDYDIFASLREILSFVIPYLNIMVLYFLVLIYGQGVANSVIMEKTSKLMDTFLLTVRPGAMVLGKVLAICLGAVIQIVAWLAALLAGLAGGCALARTLAPETMSEIVLLFENISFFMQVFSPVGMILGILVIIAGFLLYCSLSAFGASMAGKPEDLSSTNSIFSLVLVASFMLTVYLGGFNGNIDSNSWLYYMPFSAIFIVPAQAVLGITASASTAVSLAIIVIFAFLAMFLAGKVYRMFALYKGDPPKIGKVFSMLRKG